ncbi:hypothetical protein NMY22_g14763 [Coprinellus aureogranulatus]|nr:hypothetical protein NMY22_g14763 [Coprinellus aureogranulatus]
MLFSRKNILTKGKKPLYAAGKVLNASYGGVLRKVKNSGLKRASAYSTDAGGNGSVPGGGRGGGRGNGGTVREAVKLEASQGRLKPASVKISTATAPLEPSERTPSTPKSKNSSRRLSRSTPAPIAVQPPTPSTELHTPTARPSNNSNRRRRSQVGKDPALLSKPTSDDTLVKPDRALLVPVPPTAPQGGRDAPPHISRGDSGDRSPAEMKANIDALVEHVRSVAMADNRPTTPGSHIDWAGDDDDSLPDLNDWGIPTLAASQTISPIIVDGLKPLPEPLARPTPLQPEPPNERESRPVAAPNKKTERREPPKRAPDWNLKSLHPSLSGRPTRKAREDTSKPVPALQVKDAAPEPANLADDSEREPSEPGMGVKERTEAAPAAPEITVTAEEGPTIVASPLASRASQGRSPSPEKSLADSIHAPASARDPLFGGIGDKSGLAASIHAPKPSEATSAPATITAYNSPPRDTPLRNDSQWGHSRRPASTSSHPRNQRPNAGRGYNHSRNHSSPHTSAVDGSHRQPHPHARPVINADAISRLARTIVSTTPKSAPPITASSD